MSRKKLKDRDRWKELVAWLNGQQALWKRRTHEEALGDQKLSVRLEGKRDACDDTLRAMRRISRECSLQNTYNARHRSEVSR